MKFFLATGKEIEITSREREVALRVALGEDRKTIASELEISIRTVDDFLCRLRQKAGVTSTYRLIFLLARPTPQKLRRKVTA